MTKPKVSIGIPFTHWNEFVKESTNGCLSLDYPNFTIVLVPNTETEIPARYKNHPHIVIEPSRVSSIAVKRNMALAAVPSDFYACTDSDAYPDPQWLANAVAHFETSEDIWIVGGPNLSPAYTQVRRRAAANALKSMLVSGPRVFAKKRSSPRYVRDLQTCNLVIKKAALQELKGFDESFATGEDTDFCERVIRRGKKIYFSPDVLVYHHARPLFRQFIKQKIVFGYATIPFIRKNFSLSKLFIFLPAIFILYVILGWVGIWWSKTIFFFWAGSILLYLAAVMVETWRWSQIWREMPLTLAAIVIGNLAPGIGTLMNIVGLPINYSKFYVNYIK